MGERTNLEYGSYAPGAPPVFIKDTDFQHLWSTPERVYILAEADPAIRLQNLVKGEGWFPVARSGGKLLVSNQPLPEKNSTR